MNKKKKASMNWRTTDYNDGVNIQQLGASKFELLEFRIA
jgi:hypothetical protein